MAKLLSEMSLDEIRRVIALVPVSVKPYPLVAIVDAADQLATQYNWYGSRAISRLYARRNIGDGKVITLHRWVAERAFGPCPGEDYVCDVINQDPLDCRRANLRWCHKDETTWKTVLRPERDAKRRNSLVLKMNDGRVIRGVDLYRPRPASGGKGSV